MHASSSEPSKSRGTRLLAAVCSIALLLCARPGGRPAPHQSPTTEPATQPSADAKPATGPDDHLSVTRHELSLHGRTLAYEATAGTLGV